ncbi:MAG: chorismate-binding protein, partial [Bacteroidota bacterium]
MESKLKTLTLTDRKSLIESLIQSGYAFAAWSMPQSRSVMMIISLTDASQTEKQLSEMDSGFLVNEFASNHPIRPYFISADILIKDEQLSLDPKAKASEIDELISSIDTQEIGKRDQVSETISASEGNNFIDAVEAAVQEIRNGEFEKVVLSRTKDLPLPEDFNAWELFTAVNEKYVNAFCSLSFIPGKGVWIGATPELLISDDTERFKTVSLAGTKGLENDQELSEIAWTQKEIE